MAKQPWLVGGKVLEIAVVDSCDDLTIISPTYLRLGRKLLWLRKRWTGNFEIVGFQKNGICYSVIPKLLIPLGFQNRFLVTGISPPLGESLWNYTVLRFFFCELPLSIHSCAKVAWSLGAASLSMTRWDLGWLPTRSGGLRTSLGRQNWHCSPNQKQTSHTIIFRKAPFRSHQWLRGHFFVQSSFLPGCFIAGVA